MAPAASRPALPARKRALEVAAPGPKRAGSLNRTGRKRNPDAAISIASYLILVTAIPFWLELSLGAVRRVLQIAVVSAVTIAIATTCLTLSGRSPDASMPINNALGVFLLLVVFTASGSREQPHSRTTSLLVIELVGQGTRWSEAGLARVAEAGG